MEPTPQARQVIALMLQAEEKGLSSDDYDGPRWNDRLGKLKPATPQPTEADAVRFDLALTVCAMRYVSDLHVGKVNPKHFAFALDDESKRYDLAEFLRDHLVGAGDVAGFLAQVNRVFRRPAELSPESRCVSKLNVHAVYLESERSLRLLR